jgi:hypothetical protein
MTEAINTGESAVEINSPSLVQYLNTKLESISDRLAIKSPEVDEDMIDELMRFGIESLTDLDRHIPAGLLEHWASLSTPQTYVGMLRDAMMYADMDTYFDKAWLRKWTGWDGSNDGSSRSRAGLRAGSRRAGRRNSVRTASL